MITIAQNGAMLKELVGLVWAHRTAFGQERVFVRVLAVVLWEVLCGRGHKVTDVLRAGGVQGEDWTAWYRLWQGKRYDEERVAREMLRETLRHVGLDEPYVVGGDSTSVPRTSATMEGSGWMRCARNPVWRISIHRAQRFFNGSWLVPMQAGFSRAIGLRWLAAFTEKSPRQVSAATTEQQAGVTFLGWVRQQLDALGRRAQPVLGLFDGSYDRKDFWQKLPHTTICLVRTAKNRALCFLSPAGAHGNRKYGDAAPAPQDYLTLRTGWKTVRFKVRGHLRRVVYRVEGPFVRRNVGSNLKFFLLVVRGQKWRSGNTTKRRDPVYYLVNALPDGDGWALPLPAPTLLAWAWQRWELEVMHREVKSSFGLGDKQCFHPHAAVASVQWSAWVYSLLMLAALRCFGLHTPVPRPDAWQRHPRRCTVAVALHAAQRDLTSPTAFSGIFAPSTRNWHAIEALLQASRPAHPFHVP